MKKIPVQSLLIVLLGMAAGLVANLISPHAIPLLAPPKPAAAPSEYIALDQARRLWQNGTALFLDAREPADYAAGHIGNALNLPILSFDQYFGQVAPLLTLQSELVIYCDGAECELSHRLADRLHSLGYTNLHVLFNGWTAWNAAALPVTKGEAQ